MGNSSSKPDDGPTSDATIVSPERHKSRPTTLTPLLSSLARGVGTPATNSGVSTLATLNLGTPPSSSVIASSSVSDDANLPESPLNNDVTEMVVTAFAGDSPVSSRTQQGQPSVRPSEMDQTGSNGVGDISHPSPARPHVRHLSELIDLTLLADEEETAIRSPSGHLLGRDSFEGRHDRPVTMRERQERVRQGVMSQRAKEADPEKTAEGRKRPGGFCGCFGPQD